MVRRILIEEAAMAHTLWVRGLLWNAIVIGAVVGVVLQGTVAQAAGDAATSSNVTPMETELPISSEEMQDLEFLAQQNDRPLDEVIEQYAWRDDFTFIVSDIRDLYGEEFTDAKIIDGHHARIAFKGSAPDGVHSIVLQFERSVPTVTVAVVQARGYSEQELETGIEAAHYAVYRSPHVDHAVTTYDVDTRSITTRVLLADEARDVTEADLATIAQNAIRESSQGRHLPFTTAVVISSASSLGGEDSASYHYGGELLSTCTSGFGTRSSSSTSGTRGISTAGHCGNSQSDDGFALTFKKEHKGTYGDFQWHTGPKTHSNKFYAGSTSTTETDLRSVLSTGSPTVGLTLCKNGKTNQKSCQDVRKLGVCNDTACKLVQMGERLAAPGDSGGPIYFGSVAYGLHQGKVYDPIWPFDRDVFSRADQIHQALGVYIATN